MRSFKSDAPGAGPTGALVPAYFENTLRPLQSAFFLLPLILIYEAGLVRYGTAAVDRTARDIYARRLLYDVFEWFGISGYYLPGLVVMVVLVSIHLVRRDSWCFKPRHYMYMGVESIALSLPLFVFSLVLFRGGRVASAADSHAILWQGQLVFSIGAGIYEELLFRLIGLAVLHGLFADVFGLASWASTLLSIALSAMAFALYHFDFTEQNPFIWGLFLFYALAGIYFAGIYLARGFGVAAASHAMYDVLVMLFQLVNSHNQVGQ